MLELERIVVLIKPKQKMYQWLKNQPETDPKLTLHKLRSDSTALLIPPFKTPKKAREYIEGIYPGIFENELESWHIPEERWPDDRSIEVFAEWFDVEYHSLVLDLAAIDDQAERLLKEEKKV